MWIVFKLLMAVAGLCIRLLAKYASAGSRGYSKRETDGQTWYVKVHSTKSTIHGTTFAVPVAAHPVFKLTVEGFWDRTFKSMGLAQEIQSGDRSFDERVYIACDSPAFERRLALDKETRALILELFDGGAQKILSDGTLLWAYFRRDQRNSAVLPKLMLRFSENLSKTQRIPYHLLHDRFVWRAVLAESLVWGLATYTILGACEWLLDNTSLYLDPRAVFERGMWAGAAGAFIAFFSIAVFMRGSSRGHRVIVESAIVLALCLPFGGMLLVSDVNIGLDKSESETVVRRIEFVFAREHRGRRGRRWYSYHLSLAPGPEPIAISTTLPLHIEVKHEIYTKAAPGMDLDIEVGRGFLDLPYYRSLTARIGRGRSH